MIIIIKVLIIMMMMMMMISVVIIMEILMIMIIMIRFITITNDHKLYIFFCLPSLERCVGKVNRFTCVCVCVSKVDALPSEATPV